MIEIRITDAQITLTRGDETLTCTRAEAPALVGQLLQAFGLGGDAWRRGYATGYADGLRDGHARAHQEIMQAERKRPAIEAALRRN